MASTRSVPAEPTGVLFTCTLCWHLLCLVSDSAFIEGDSEGVLLQFLELKRGATVASLSHSFTRFSCAGHAKRNRQQNSKGRSAGPLLGFVFIEGLWKVTSCCSSWSSRLGKDSCFCTPPTDILSIKGWPCQTDGSRQPPPAGRTVGRLFRVAQYR